MELDNLRSYQKLLERDSKLAAQVKSVYNATKETINSISGCYNNYTMHDMGHGLRVAAYMEELAFGIDDKFESNIMSFSALEIALLLLSALLHDIGMFIRPEDKEDISNNRIKYTSSLTFEGVLKVVDNNKDEAIKEIVRITHAQRIYEYIDYDFNGNTISKILMLDDKYPYADDVAVICVAHGENYEYLKQLRTRSMKGNYSYNLQFLAAILRIADYLDLDKQRTPVLWYKMMNIEGFSKEEWEKHFIIHNEKKLKKYMEDKFQIFFEGKSSNAKIHRKYLRYVDELKAELENADLLLNSKEAEEPYLFKISTKIDDSVITEGFMYSDLRLNLDYSAITELLMGKNIYGDNKLGLREIVQNSIDACELMNEKQQMGEEIVVEPMINIILSQKNNYVKIKDTGIGMTLDIVKKHFLNIGKSYYKSNEYLFENYNYKPIGQYGIGFLACFLLSDNVIVKTKHYNSSEINQIELEKSSEYVVTNTEETGNFFGTEIILEYDKFFTVFSSKLELISFLEKYFYTSIPIRIKDIDVDTAYTDIKNSCNNIISKEIEKDPSKKYEDICVQEYSDIFEGTLKICDKQKEKAFEIIDLAELNMDKYRFDVEAMKFIKLNAAEELANGYYHLVEYGIIEDQMYNQIIRSKRTSKSKRQAILLEAQRISLFIDAAMNFSYIETSDNDYELGINGVTVRKLLQDSGLPYYEILVEQSRFFQNVFVYENKYINMQYCVMGNDGWYRRNSDDYEVDSYFYNKGVWIKDFRSVACKIPYALKVVGTINYLGDNIKLDVSRNMIISDRKFITNELANILLKFMRNKKERDEGWNKMLDAIIQFNALKHI